MFMGRYIFPGADASLPLGWVVNQLEAAGFEIRSTETVGIHYSATIRRWYHNWIENKEAIEAKYGQFLWRLWTWFLAWSVVIAKQGSSTCYRIVCHKNSNEFDRKTLIM
jgi:cyclopropane fatty-acyl-phospholipid synthase-like methyltransferase